MLICKICEAGAEVHVPQIVVWSMEQLQRLQVSLDKPVNASHAFHSPCFSPHAFPASFSVSKKEVKVLVICWCSSFAEAAEGISALSSL